MKHLLISLSLILFATMASAKRVEPEKARLTAKNFYYEQRSRSGEPNYASLNVEHFYPVTFDGEIVYNTFTFNDGGWVIVSADDAVTPVLGYAFEGASALEEQPPQFVAWMEGYARQINYAQQHNLTANATTKASWERLGATDPGLLNTLADGRDIAPMLVSNWNQGNPYNFLCPADAAGSGGHVYAGCVATAMAQVLYYYRWPETGTGQHCYTPSGYPQQCADFANTTYAWNEMVNSTGNRDTAMGLIQWHCGIAVDMMYGAGGSGAYSEDAADALKTYFKYHPNTTLKYKDNYTEEEWTALLRENLDAKRPMYYHGFGSGGHAFNVDGYQGTDFFHFNWGWSGSYNGFFYLSNLNPGGSNFTEGQGAIVNIYPDTLSYTYPGYCSGQTLLTALKGTFEDNSCPLDYQNNTECSWLIAPDNQTDSITQITISFQRFQTEAGTDQVTIYQGSSELGEIVGQFSGNDIPATVSVDGNEALVTFTTDGVNTQPGWFASYTCTTMNWCQGMTILTNAEGTISDGSFDFNYKNSTMCRWKIIPEGTGAVELRFTSFRTASENDLLRIYDLGSETLIATYSGIYAGSDLPSPVSAPSGQLFLIFSTDGTDTEAGWEAEYFTYPVGTEAMDTPFEVSIFPNPVTDKVTVSIRGNADNPVSASITDITGNPFITEQWRHTANTEHTFDISTLAGGIYLIRIQTPEGVVVRKVVKK